MEQVTQHATRRRFIQHSTVGLLAVTSPLLSFAGSAVDPRALTAEPCRSKYPATDDRRTASIVGASHGDFETVKKMVAASPELALATWDWGFGDWESALGAASHVGRKDIATFLIDHGARPTIFTLTMMGALDAVKATIKAIPGIQRTPGPHGITLLQHARNRLGSKDLPARDQEDMLLLIQYLESLGDADIKPISLDVSAEEKAIYVGQYKYGDDTQEELEVGLGMRQLLQIARKGLPGRVLHKVGDHQFSPAGAPSVIVKFTVVGGRARSLTIHPPDPAVVADRV